MNKQNSKPTLNRATRRQLAAMNRRQSRRRSVNGGSAAVPNAAAQISSDVHVYTDDSFKNKAKVAYTHGLQQMKDRVAAINAKYELPERINTLRQSFARWMRFWPFCDQYHTTVRIINRDGKARDFLPDRPGDHRILCHRSIARHLVSQCCMLVRITANTDSEGRPIDGSWAIVPAQYAMMRTTTIQHLRRRPFFFLRRYWYEISFDGRVQPAHLLFDYNLNPTARRTTLYVTHEYVPVRGRDEENDYFRFWATKPKRPVNGGTTAVRESRNNENPK